MNEIEKILEKHERTFESIEKEYELRIIDRIARAQEIEKNRRNTSSALSTLFADELEGILEANTSDEYYDKVIDLISKYRSVK